MNQNAYNRWLKGEVRKGDILLSINKRSLVSRLIAEITDSQWSHAFLYVGDRRVIESTVNREFSGVQLNPLCHYLNDKFVVGLYRMDDFDDVERRAAVIAAKEHLGIRYSFLQILYDLLTFTIGLENRKAWTYNAPGMKCSELIGEVYETLGKPLSEKLRPWQLAPGDIGSSPRLRRVMPEGECPVC